MKDDLYVEYYSYVLFTSDISREPEVLHVAREVKFFVNLLWLLAMWPISSKPFLNSKLVESTLIRLP